MEEHIRIILEAVNRAQAELRAVNAGVEGLNKTQTRHLGIQEKLKTAIAGTVKVIASIAIQAAIAGAALVAFGKRGIDNLEKLKKEASDLGVEIGKLQKLKFAAELGDIGGEQAVASLKFLQKAIGEASDSSSEAARSFRDLGISEQDLKQGDVIDVALKVGDAFAKYAVDGNLAVHANSILGKSSKQVIGFFAQGGPAIRAAGDELNKFGLATAQTAADADTFNDNFVRAGAILDGIRTQALAQLLPDLIQLQQNLLTVASDEKVVSDVTTSLRDTFLFLAQGTVFLVQGFRAIGIVLGQGLALQVTTLINLFQGFGQVIFAMVAVVHNFEVRIIDLIKRLAGLGEIMRLTLKGDFQGAREAFETFKNTIGTGVSELATGLENDLTEAWKAGSEAAVKAGTDAKNTIDGTINDLEALGQETQKLLDALDTSKRPTGPVLGPPAPGGGGIGGAGFQGKQSIGGLSQTDPNAGISDQDLQLMTELSGLDLQEKFSGNSFAQFFAPLLDGSLSKGSQSFTKSFSSIVDGSLETGISGLSSGIAGAALGTESWSEAFKNVGKSILTNLISAFIQLVVEAIILFAIVTALNAIAPGLGSALGSIAGLASGGFAEGGLVPGAPSSKDNRLAAVATGEYIFDAGTVAKVGPRFMAGMHKNLQRGIFPGFAQGGLVSSFRTSFATGGLVTSGKGQGPGLNVAMTNTRNQQRNFMRKDGTKIIIDQLSGRGNTILS